jgi:hypothetical protein
MILSTLKLLVFGMVMLLVGQIPLGHSTLGAKFTDQVTQACRSGIRSVREHKMFQGFELSSFSRWWKGARPTATTVSKNTAKEVEDTATDADGLTQTDREALIRLLE